MTYSEMQYRFLGNSGLKVSVLGYGGWLTCGNQIDIDQTATMLKAAYDRGVNFFDSAEQYSNGDSERAMGAAFKKFGWKRSSLVIATKIYWGGDGVNESGLSRKHIIEGLAASLERMQLDYVDLVYAHRSDNCTPMEEIVRAFNFLIENGKALYWGTSEWSAEQISDAHRVAERLNLIAPVMEQPQYNMFCRDRFEREYAPLYKKYKLGTTIWSALASGLLTGKYNTEIPADSRFATLSKTDSYINSMRTALDKEEGKAKIAKVTQLQVIAKELNCTVSQLCLAWCLSNQNVSSVILGASKISQLEENLGAIDVYKLMDDKVLAKIEAVLKNKPEIEKDRH